MPYFGEVQSSDSTKDIYIWKDLDSTLNFVLSFKK